MGRSSLGNWKSPSPLECEERKSTADRVFWGSRRGRPESKLCATHAHASHTRILHTLGGLGVALGGFMDQEGLLFGPEFPQNYESFSGD